MPWSCLPACLPMAHLFSRQPPRPRFAIQAREAIRAGVTRTSRQALEPRFTLERKKAKHGKLKNPHHYETNKLNAELCLPRALAATPAKRQVPRKETGRAGTGRSFVHPGAARVGHVDLPRLSDRNHGRAATSGRTARNKVEGREEAMC